MSDDDLIHGSPSGTDWQIGAEHDTGPRELVNRAIGVRPAINCDLNATKGSFLRMIHRRHFLRSAALPIVALALSTPVHHAMAQQTSGKPEVKLSELRPVVKRYVERLSEAYEKHTGTGFSEEEKKEMIEETIANMKERNFYAYIDP